MQFAQRKGSGKGKDDDSEALAAGELSSGKKRRGKRNIECWNCGKKGHFSNKCPDPKVDKNSKGKSSENTANAVASDEEGAWAAEEVMERDWFSLDEVEDEVEIEGESCEEVVEIGDTSGLALVVTILSIFAISFIFVIICLVIFSFLSLLFLLSFISRNLDYFRYLL